jgi:hypothetical protein
MLKAYLHPKPKPNHKHYYAYDVVFDGERLVTDSRDPEDDLARALLAQGITGKVTLHHGNTGKPRTIVNIEKATLWCVGSKLERYKWKPPEDSYSSPPAGEWGSKPAAKFLNYGRILEDASFRLPVNCIRGNTQKIRREEYNVHTSEPARSARYIVRVRNEYRTRSGNCPAAGIIEAAGCNCAYRLRIGPRHNVG